MDDGQSVSRLFSLLCLFGALVVSHYCFEGRTLVLIASVPGHCLPFTFFRIIIYQNSLKKVSLCQKKHEINENTDTERSASSLRITKTSPCKEDPLTSHFYTVKLGFTGVYISFLFFFATKHRLCVLVRTASGSNVYPRSMF